MNLGNVYECFATSQLSANGHTLYYCDSKKIGEVDYLVDDYDGLSVKAIEIKSGRDYMTHRAIDRLIESGCAGRGLIMSNSGTVKRIGGVTYLPIYALMFV